jgi:hypothetical protein
VWQFKDGERIEGALSVISGAAVTECRHLPLILNVHRSSIRVMKKTLKINTFKKGDEYYIRRLKSGRIHFVTVCSKMQLIVFD